MSKSIKFTNDVYLDSTSVVHNKKILSEVLNTKDVYSASEVKTNKVWIDGKPIYRKVVSGTLDDSISTGLTNVNYIKFSGFYTTSGGAYIPLCSTRPNYPEYAIGYNISNNTIYFDKGKMASGNAYIVLEYTKITD